MLSLPPPGLLPSDDWPVVELPTALADLLASWPDDEPLPEGLSHPRAVGGSFLPGETGPGEPEPGEPDVDELATDEPEALVRAGVCAAGFGPRSEARGAGFASAGTADLVPPGGALAGLAQDAWDEGLERLNDDQLIGVTLAWRRLASWASAGELAAVAELDRRRHAQVAAGADPHVAEHVTDEVAAALTLTAAGADRLVGLAVQLHRLLPGTRAALAAGLIDQRKAAVIADEMSAMEPVKAAAAEHLFLPDAPGQTTGQLRMAVKRAVAFIDSEALQARREEARKEARVEVWGEPSGTSALAGRDLPSASVVAASKHLTALAKRLKALGAAGTIDQLRARAYVALLQGQSPSRLLAEAQSPVPPAGEAVHGEPGPAANEQPACSAPVPAAIPAGLGGSVNLTMPLAALFRDGREAGEVPGYGFLPAADCRALAAAQTKARWCLTLTGADGRAVAHGCATGQTGSPAAGQRR